MTGSLQRTCDDCGEREFGGCTCLEPECPACGRKFCESPDCEAELRAAEREDRS